ncbi:uncharacterized protein LOC110714013 [Chenopodium quinoa]|uniref:uncharacterized protein LOC110714013 n=1 Tax=Chenopodium quinoa TaxID=63459 RepID=UPI000B78BCC9|nr:uncharacterized protein LOC110714013 [Chenopodium quinoa]
MCGEEDETVMHMLLGCSSVHSIWRFSALRLELKIDGTRGLVEWYNDMMEIVKETKWWELFWCLAWGIWLRRNGWVFEGRRKNVGDIIHKASNLVGEFEEARLKDVIEQPIQKLASIWKAPNAGLYKLNTDASCVDQQTLGIGGVLRDRVGDVLLACCSCLKGTFEVDVGEALAMRHCLRIVIEAGFREIMIETDNMKLFQHLQKGCITPNAFGKVVMDVLKIIRECRRVVFSFVKKTGNGVADKLARLSCNYSESRVWLEKYPLELQEAICKDLTNLML